ncbi:uncharacterized protein LOC135836840 isoform X2 [Planococcus citri]
MASECLRLLVKNLGKDKLLTDIANVDYTRGEELLSEQSISSNAITEPFCDSLKLAQICENSQWNEQYSHECQNYLIDKFFKTTATLPNFSTEPSREAPVPLHSNSQSVNTVWQIIRDKPVVETFSDPVCAFYDVTFESVELKQLLRGNPNILQILEENNYFLVELHISQDFAGIFNKAEMCDHLLKNFDFCYGDEDSELRNNCNVIRKEETGIDCITWTSSNAKIQIYNKFISQMTNPGACNKMGNRIIDFIDPSNKQLQKTFSSRKAKEHGITTLKLTIHNYGNDVFEKKYEPSCFHLLKTINEMYLKEEDAPIYSVSLAKMWQKLTNVLQNSCCVVYDDKILQFAYWGNSCTGQFTGVQIALSDDPEVREEEINYALSQLSFNNLPVNYLYVIPEKEQIIQKRFKKSGETFFTSSDKLKQTIPFDVDITGTGLIETHHVIPEVLRKFRPLPRIHSITEIRPVFLVCESIYPAQGESQVDDLSAGVQSIAISTEKDETPVTAEETIESSSDRVTSPNRSESELGDISNSMGTMSIQHFDSADNQALAEYAEKFSQEWNESRLNDLNHSVVPVETEEDNVTSQNQSESGLDDISNAMGTMSIQHFDSADNQALAEYGEKFSQEWNESRLNDSNHSVVPVEEITVETEENNVTSQNRSESGLDDISNAMGSMSIQHFDSADNQALAEYGEKFSQEWNESRLNDSNHSVVPVEEITLETEESEIETIEEPNFKLLDYFNEKNWKNLETAGTYEIFAFTVKRKGIHPYVGILASKKNEDCKSIYHLNGPQKDCFIRCHSKPEFLTQKSYFVSTTNNLKIIHPASENPFAEFKTNGTESFQGKSIPKIERMKFYDDEEWKNYGNPILGETHNSLKDLFLWKNWKNLDQNGEYQVYAFTVNYIVKHPCVGVLAKEKNSNSKHVYFVKGFAKLRFMKLYDDRNTLEMIDHAIYSCNNLEIVYLENEQPVAEFKTNGMDKYKNHAFPKVEDIRFFSITSSQYEDIEPKIVEEKCLSFEETRDQLSTLFRGRKWKDLNQNGEYVVYAFTVTDDLRFPYVGVLAREENDDSKHVYVIKYSNENTEDFKKLYDLRELLQVEKSYDLIKFDESDVVFLATKLPLAKFRTIGMDSQDGPMIEDLYFY